MHPVAAAMEIAYRSLWRAAWPFVRWFVRRKDRLRLMDAPTTRERFGRSLRPRGWDRAESPPWVLWIHGASVGECLSALPLVDFVLSPRFPIARERPTRVVVTTTTAAARQLLQRRLDQDSTRGRAVCVFAPLDAPASVERFYESWRPDAGLLVESELWPTLILEADRRRIPVGVINARLSDRSIRWWSIPLVHSFVRDIVGRFSIVLCQDSTHVQRFSQIGASSPRVAINLKFASSRVESNALELACVRHSLRDRSVWLAASTHEGEELLMARVHQQLCHARHAFREKRALLVIVPRHPERTSAIAQQIEQQLPSLRVTLRSESELPSMQTDVFIVDSMGELALFFDAIETVVMGGTFVPRGGHNPIEPLRAGCAVALGPHSCNFSDVISQLKSHGDVIEQLDNPDQLAEWLTRRLQEVTEERNRQTTADLMQSLSVKAMTAHETELVRWLVDTKREESCKS